MTIADLSKYLPEIESPVHLKGIHFRSCALAAKDSVHVNHLNRAVREVTGKTTTLHLKERIVAEAKALLLHTAWNISEISHSLGYEYPTYFNNFFKKQTGIAPNSFRIESI